MKPSRKSPQSSSPQLSSSPAVPAEPLAFKNGPLANGPLANSSITHSLTHPPLPPSRDRIANPQPRDWGERNPSELRDTVSLLRKKLQQLSQEEIQPSRKEENAFVKNFVLPPNGDSQSSDWIELAERDAWDEIGDGDFDLTDGLQIIPINAEDHSTLPSANSAPRTTPKHVPGDDQTEPELVEGSLAPDSDHDFPSDEDVFAIGDWQASRWSLISTGCAALDAWFPDQAMRRGSVMEFVSPACAGGVTHFCLTLAQQICGADGLLVVIDRRHDFYPASVMAVGFDLQNVLIVRPENDEDHRWALEQALADESVSAVWTRIETLDDRYQRRCQLAAERSGVIGLLQRPESVIGHPTWAWVQFQVSPSPYSHLLTSNPQAYPSTGTHQGTAEAQTGRTHRRAASSDNLRQENWVLDVTALRCRGLFGPVSLRLELHNQSMQQIQQAAKDSPFCTPAVEAKFFSHRVPHPNDPAITKNLPTRRSASAKQHPPSQERPGASGRSL